MCLLISGEFMSYHFYAHIGACRFTYTLLSLVIYLPISSAIADEKILTLVQAQQIATARSLVLMGQDKVIFASHEMAIGASQLPDPILSMELANLPASGDGAWKLNREAMTMRRIAVTQEITSVDKLKARNNYYQHSAEVVAVEKTLTETQIERDTAIAWLALYYAQEMATLMKQKIAQNKQEIMAIETAYRSNADSQMRVYAARSALVLAEDKLSEIQRQVQQEKINLSRWIGDFNEHLSDPPDTAKLIYFNRADMVIESFEKVIKNLPELMVLESRAQLAQADVTIAQTNKKSDWSVSAAFQQRGSAYGNMISVGVSMPFQWDQKNRQDKQLSAKVAAVEQIQFQRDELSREKIAEIRTMRLEWQNNLVRVKRFEQELIPYSIAATKAATAAYSGGKISLNELLATKRSEIDIRLQILQLQAETAKLWAQLNFLFPTRQSNN
jgi:outer membrane protein TolC